jgi:hypothetical protein
MKRLYIHTTGKKPGYETASVVRAFPLLPSALLRGIPAFDDPQGIAALDLHLP